MPTTYVLFDIVTWTTPIEGEPRRREYHIGRLGEKIDVPQAELERLTKLKAVGDRIEATATVSALAEPLSTTEVQLDSMGATEVIAYLQQHPSEAAGIREAELGRPKPRKTVVDAADKVQSALQEALEADQAEHDAFLAAEQRAYENTAGAGSGAPQIPGSENPPA